MAIYKNIDFFVPNEIFDDLHLNYKSNKHHSFAICYYILISYFYYISFYGEKFITQSEIKAILGYNPTNTKIDYIIKQNGLLDTSAYTETTNNIPVQTNHVNNMPEFIMYNNNSINLIRNYKIKYPVKCFHRYGSDDLNGTFYDISNTTKINMNIFFKIINKLGCCAFVIYLLIKQNNNLIKNNDYISKKILLSKPTVAKYITMLANVGIIIITNGIHGTHSNSSLFTINLRV